MQTIHQDNLASIEFSLDWAHDGIFHHDVRYAKRVNFWRDMLPRGIFDAILGAGIGRRISVDFAPRELIIGGDRRHVKKLSKRNIAAAAPSLPSVAPRYGRFYPAGILRGVSGVFPGSIIPFRCTRQDGDAFVADFNHPLGDKPLRLSAAVEDVRDKFDERGGTSNDWTTLLADGPGFQARVNGAPTDFFSDDPFARDDETDDGAFYTKPRMVHHIDAVARGVISDLYGRLIPPGSRVLDLMSSWTSHLPEHLPVASVHGLGMNRGELAANMRLSGYTIQDLNRNPLLPYGPGAFDAVICTVSVEYLTNPFKVFDEIARVLRPGGVLIVTFSNRWFPPKAIRIWKEIHPFERPGLVLEYFLRSGRFEKLHTLSYQGKERPRDDKYYSQMPEADPVFAVWGARRAAG